MLHDGSLLDINEKLQQMAERLMNGEVCKDVDTTKTEVEKAHALVDIANTVVSLYDVENQQRETSLKMAKVADDMGYSYVPKEIEEFDKKACKRIVNQEEFCEIENKKKLLKAQIN